MPAPHLPRHMVHTECVVTKTTGSGVDGVPGDCCVSVSERESSVCGARMASAAETASSGACNRASAADGGRGGIQSRAFERPR